MEIQLLDAERECLLRVLDREYENARSEVHHTKTPEFRERLQKEESILKDLIDKLQPSQTT